MIDCLIDYFAVDNNNQARIQSHFCGGNFMAAAYLIMHVAK